MSMIRKILGYIFKRLNFLFPDEIYLKILYLIYMGKKLDLENPKTFNEKLQWLKLYNRMPEYVTMVDKYAVKQYVSDIIGQDYVIPTLFDWERPQDIDFERLPDKFVLKATQAGGSMGVVICKDKSSLNTAKVIKRLKIAFRRGLYAMYREWPYKNVPKRIILEPFIEDSSLGELRDYKFFCFNGKCKFFKVDFDRFSEHRANYYDTEGHLLPFGERDLPPDYEKEIRLPDSLTEMIQIAEKLSSHNPFLRVDLYEANGKVLFGEMTFYPASGFGSFTSDEWDYKLGEWLNLPLADSAK